VLRINPKFTLAKYAESLTYRDPAHSERTLQALRSAGLPEYSAGSLIPVPDSTAKHARGERLGFRRFLEAARAGPVCGR